MEAVKGKKIGVFGLGLIGTSLALDLSRRGHAVRGYDPVADHAVKAREMGAITEILAAPEGEFEVVVLAAPPRANLTLLGARVQAELILDVGSVKGPIVRRARELRLPFVGGHPLAGTAGGGPGAAVIGLFADRTFVLCPAGGPMEMATALVEELGAKPRVMDPDDHDRALARSSHAVYLMSCALAELLQETPTDLLGPAAFEMLRVATSPPALWEEILQENQAAVGSALRELGSSLEGLSSGSADRLRAAQLSAKRLREESTHGS